MDNRNHGVHSWPMHSGCIELIYSSALHSIDSTGYFARRMVENGYHVRGMEGVGRAGVPTGKPEDRKEWEEIGLVSIFIMYHWSAQLHRQPGKE